MMKAPLAAAKSIGVSTVDSDISPTPTTADFTPNALKIKSSGAQGLWSVMAVPGNVALAKALGQQSVHLKAAIYDGNYEESVLQSAGQTLEGTYTQNPFAPARTSATTQYEAALAKYAAGVFGGYIETYAWVSTDLIISGLEQAGSTLTAATLAAGLHKLTSYNASGLLPEALNFSEPKTATANIEKCFWYPQVKNGAWVSSPDPVCGDLVSS
jgi:branched-chain amino acid transport system substrate-binding protein